MKIKSIKIITLFIASLIGFSSLAVIPAFAADCDPNLPASVLEANGCNAGSEDKLPNLITNILNAVIGIVGFVAVVFVIIGGINYMTSAGNSEKTKKARDTILYALIGIVVCVLAYVIVNWAIKAIGG